MNYIEDGNQMDNVARGLFAIASALRALGAAHRAIGEDGLLSLNATIEAAASDIARAAASPESWDPDR